MKTNPTGQAHTPAHELTENLFLGSSVVVVVKKQNEHSDSFTTAIPALAAVLLSRKVQDQ